MVTSEIRIQIQSVGAEPVSEMPRHTGFAYHRAQNVTQTIGVFFPSPKNVFIDFGESRKDREKERETSM